MKRKIAMMIILVVAVLAVVAVVSILACTPALIDCVK